jgi:hypothetical protein
MPYIASLIRAKNKNRTQEIKPTPATTANGKVEFLFTQSLVDAVNDFASVPPYASVRPYQIDYRAWHARLEGWNPVQTRIGKSPATLQPSIKQVAKAA